MIPDWETNCCYFSDRMEAAHPALFASLQQSLAGVEIRIIQGTSDIWCRDFMPIQIDDGTFRQFVYSPDYLRGYEQQITPANRCRLSFMEDFRRESIVLDGGNVVASSSKVILTDKVFTENPSIPRKKMQDRLESLFQAECILIPKEPYDVVGHADGMVRFASEDHVLINDYSAVDPRFGEKLRTFLENSGLTVELLPMFHEPQVRGAFQSAVGIYTNFLRVGDVVVIPSYHRPEDEIALETLRRTIPNARVSKIQCRELSQQGGVLNCISWTIKVSQ